MSHEQLQVLATGVKDFLNAVVADHRPEVGHWLAVLDGLKIDDGGDPVRRDLDKLQARNKTILSDEFGIDGNAVLAWQLLAQPGQVIRRRNIWLVQSGSRGHSAGRYSWPREIGGSVLLRLKCSFKN